MASRVNVGNYLGLVQALAIIVPLTIAVRASNNMLMTTIPLLARYSFKFSNTMVGVLSALTSLMTLVSSGFINSRVHVRVRRALFIASSAIYALVYPLFSLSNAATIWALSAIAGFTLGFLMPNIITSASLLPDRRARERLLNIYTLSLSISLILGPAIESVILRYVSLKQSFMYFEAFPLLALAISFLVRFPREDEGGDAVSMFRVLSNPGFIAAVINIATYNIVFSYLMTFGGIYARDAFSMSYSQVELLLSSFFITSFLGRLYLSIKPAERLWPYMAASVAMSVTGLALAYITQNPIIYVVALLILGIPHGLTYPLSVVSISRAFRPEERNAANSIFFSFMMLIGIVTPGIMGYVADSVGLRNSFAVLIPPVLILLYVLSRFVTPVDKPKP